MEIITVTRTSRVHYDYPLHTHPVWEILFSLKGQGDIRLGDKVVPFYEGSIFCIPPGVPHCKKAPCGFIDGCIFAQNVCFPDNDVLIFEDDSVKSLTTLYSIAYDTQLKSGTNHRKVIDALCDAIFQMLSEMVNASKPQNELVDSFVHTLMYNISNPEFDIAKALNDVGYNPNYFRKIFHESAGMAPLEYLTYLRIDHAKRQLKQYGSSYSIKEIAERCGFSDPYYFSRKFKQLTGISPRDYIKKTIGAGNEMLQRTVDNANDPELLAMGAEIFESLTKDF